MTAPRAPRPIFTRKLPPRPPNQGIRKSAPPIARANTGRENGLDFSGDFCC